MTGLTIKDVDDVTKQGLRRRAPARSRSIEEQVRLHELAVRLVSGGGAAPSPGF